MRGNCHDIMTIVSEADPASAKEGPTYLNDVWAWYFHDPHDPQWTFDRYTRLGESSTVEEVLAYNDILRDSIPHGMFFVMREHIFPCWDDPSNLGGATVSLKILKDNVHRDWESIVCRIVGETFMKDGALAQSVNGLSISPKRSFCIVKIWMAGPDMLTRCSDAAIPESYSGDIHCSANTDNIKNNNSVKSH